MMIAVTARIPVQPDKKEEALAAVEVLMQGVAKEEGTLFYTLNVDEKEPNTLVFIERYKDKDALAVHSSTPHFKAFMEQAMTFAAGQPEIKIYNEVASI